MNEENMDQEPQIKIIDKRAWLEEDVSDEELKGADLDRTPTYVHQLEQQAEQNDAKLKEYIDAYKEKMDEQDKLRCRLQEDVNRRVDAGVAEVLREILPVVDNIDMALQSAENNQDLEKLLDGLVMIKGGFISALTAQGLLEISRKGDKFDPTIEEAAGVDPVQNEEQDGMVTAVLKAGYLYKDKLIRPALVRVGKMNR